ncbi:hypothetical protein TGMAS_236880 [Toxoplasma gondii MAS]|uniref:Uncharacterized protein n=6 Tax=Toxoplasma gondii TaxID=5811 RepID=V5B5L9_TOXGV|nr:hypothetical protein TGVEG_236880 [Toxoplasma gondii VEG]KFG36673.1 hypothetical protein TGP89_236880 [Toxoplasma gondii p89]KFG44113.1 hypothetical protein TGFOU_236880 [Toxoplasma gondii FOU]KFH16288.1 hypothetical protein TGMAS_236880 [Toxoplasma gondii MAS]PUA84904.1 hypothetical protein TGBR9_236880 [Toxoplasma gondii TgCATBr9]RQX70107.1 hypothetical protein TGCAST_236880 [Toxoplasma gondii CAST]
MPRYIRCSASGLSPLDSGYPVVPSVTLQLDNKVVLCSLKRWSLSSVLLTREVSCLTPVLPDGYSCKDLRAYLSCESHWNTSQRYLGFVFTEKIHRKRCRSQCLHNASCRGVNPIARNCDYDRLMQTSCTRYRPLVTEGDDRASGLKCAGVLSVSLWRRVAQLFSRKDVATPSTTVHFVRVASGCLQRCTGLATRQDETDVAWQQQIVKETWLGNISR